MQDHVQISSANSITEEKNKKHSQRDRILALLRERGAIGATNAELNAICYRYGGRLFELRKCGFTIRTESVGGGLFKFYLIGEATFGSVKAAM